MLLNPEEMTDTTGSNTWKVNGQNWLKLLFATSSLHVEAPDYDESDLGLQFLQRLGTARAASNDSVPRATLHSFWPI